MGIQSMIKKLIYPNRYSSSAYIAYLRRQGVYIGENTTIYAPMHTTIDVRKPHMISIGSYCKITSGVTILAHDYSISVPRRMYGEFIGGSGPVRIGDNCFIGMNAIILKNTIIGNNCIVGAGAVVTGGDYPDGSIIAGNPAKIVGDVCSYYKKNKDRWVENAKKVAYEIMRNTGRYPLIEEMGDGYFWLYGEHTQERIDRYPQYFRLSSDDAADIKRAYLESKPVFESYDAFLATLNEEIK